MLAAAVEFTKLGQQAYIESQHNGILFITPDGRIVPSVSSLDVQTPYPEVQNSIIIQDPDMRDHCDGPDLSVNLPTKRIKQQHCYLDRMDGADDELIRRGKAHPNKDRNVLYSQADITLYYLDTSYYYCEAHSADDYAICFYPNPLTAQQKIKEGQPLEFQAIILRLTLRLRQKNISAEPLAPSTGQHRCDPRLLQIVKPDWRLQILGPEDHTYVVP